MSAIRIAQNVTHVAEMAAEAIRDAGQQAIANEGRFSIALSGGNTPKPLYALLATRYRSAIDWTKVHVYWSDERCVPPEHPDSNYQMAKETLLEPAWIPVEHIYRMKGELTPDEAAAAYEATLRSHFLTRFPRFHIVLLGMGDDGHTASLFPHTAALKETERWVVPNYVAAKQSWRLTLTVPVINHAENVIFLATGGDKAERLKQVIEGTYQPDEMPAQLIQPANGRLTWYVDQAAASRLRPTYQS